MPRVTDDEGGGLAVPSLLSFIVSSSFAISIDNFKVSARDEVENQRIMIVFGSSVLRFRALIQLYVDRFLFISITEIVLIHFPELTRSFVRIVTLVEVVEVAGRLAFCVDS